VNAPAINYQRIAGIAAPDERKPGWARLGIFVIAAVTAVIDSPTIASSPVHPYYGAAVRSMSMSWKAFLYGGFDPAASISIDKVPGAFWVQSLSAAAFGFRDWSVALPQVTETVLTVLVLYHVVRRWAGPVAGLLAAAAMALTPMAAALARSQVADTLLTLLLVLAAGAWQRAVISGRLRPLLASAAWVGAAFQAKMGEAWVVLFAFAAVYAVAAPGTLRGRLGRLAAAGAVTVAISSTWAVAVLLTPAARRPYVDGTTNNDPLSMIFGYNGLSRVGGAGTGWSSLFSSQVAPQIGWLLPLAAIGAVAGIRWRRGTGRTDVLRAGFVMWGLWLISYLVLFSVGQFDHTYYVVVMAPAVAALAGGGMAMAWDAHRNHGAASWVLPVSLAVTVAWSAFLALSFPKFLPGIAAAVAILGTLAVLLLTRPVQRIWAGARPVGALAGILAVLAGPGSWAVATSLAGPVATTFLAAGPADSGGSTVGGSELDLAGLSPAAAAFVEQGADLTSNEQLSKSDLALIGYLRAHLGNSRYLAAVDGSNTAAPFIIGTGASLLPMGGYTGKTPFPATRQFLAMVSAGTVRYVIAQGGEADYSPADGAGNEAATANVYWAIRHCRLVGAKAYLGASAETALAPGASAGSSPLSLYDCGATTRTLTATFPPRSETP
jgi:4-amino-4-deoxy-L-arabinose transferase-like glycosyltransferase